LLNFGDRKPNALTTQPSNYMNVMKNILTNLNY
jgi:hypothetical protein